MITILIKINLKLFIFLTFSTFLCKGKIVDNNTTILTLISEQMNKQLIPFRLLFSPIEQEFTLLRSISCR